jgi:HK97 family phage major capsid protein
MPFPALAEAEKKVTAKAKELKAIFDEAGPDRDLSKVTGFANKDEVLEAIRAKNEELNDLGKIRDDLLMVDNAATRALAAAEGGVKGHLEADQPKGERKSIGELIVASDAYTGRAQKSTATIDLNIKNTLFSESAGWAPQSLRSGLVVPDAQRPILVTDLIPTVPTTQAAYVYMEETTFTNSAAEAAEGGAYGEAALALTERTSTVRKVAVFIPVTDEQLEDVDGAMAYLDNRLPFMARQRLDGQILVGDGNAPNLEGINNVSGIQTQAKGTDPVPDAVYKAMTKVRVTGRALPNAVIMHPNDWQDVRLLRTSDGLYIWGSPSDAMPERIWGVSVAQSDAQTENTAVVGDFANYSLMAVRRGLDVQISNSHSDYFASGKQALRADLRVALVFTRPAAFATVTGI